RKREEIANCEVENANCKLFGLPSSNLQFAIVILQFAFLFGHRSSLTSGLRAKPALPLTSYLLSLPLTSFPPYERPIQSPEQSSAETVGSLADLSNQAPIGRVRTQ